MNNIKKKKSFSYEEFQKQSNTKGPLKVKI